MRESIRRHPSSLSPDRRRRWPKVAAIALGVALVCLLLGFGLSRDPTAIRSPLVGRRAPSFALETLGGSSTIRLSDLRGQVVVLNFWASWCAECRLEHPALAEAWELYGDRGAVIVGVLYQDTKGAALAYAREMGGGWPLVEDPGARTALSYGVYGVPETFFIGRDGRIASKVTGPVSRETLTRWIPRLLGGSA